MRDDAYRQYAIESQDWLKAGRVRLLASLLDEATAMGTIERLLEVGAGVGQNLDTLARYGAVDAAEIDPIGLEHLKDLDVVRRLYTDRIPFALEDEYDVVCALDVIEHLDDDRSALKWLASGLRTGGFCIVSVPAYQWLFSDHDRALGHRRRYTKSTLLDAFPTDLEIVRVGYFNSVLFPVAAASRGVRGLRSRLSSHVSTPTKQRSTVPGPIDAVLRRLLGLEAGLFARRPVIPFGLTIFVLARRRE